MLRRLLRLWGNIIIMLENMLEKVKLQEIMLNKLVGENRLLALIQNSNVIVLDIAISSHFSFTFRSNNP
jgi:hypothetical protein